MDASPSSCQPALQWKLWIYTNYDCNLRCSYCVAKSSPNAPRRAIGLNNVQRLVDEAVALGFSEIFFTGGEPFILKEIYAMLAYSSARVRTSVLTNAMLFPPVGRDVPVPPVRGDAPANNGRLGQLLAVAHGNNNLILQVSLDGGVPEHHDAYRGQGSWQKTVTSIQTLQAHGLRVRLSTTETPVNTDHLDKVCDLHRSLGIPESDHFIRPLARRGHSREGLELDMSNLVPEVTVNLDGVFWHPLSTDADMQVSKSMFPLSTAVDRIREQLDAIASTGRASLMTFT